MLVWWIIGGLVVGLVLWAISAWIGLSADRRVVDTAWRHLVPHLDRRRELAARAAERHAGAAGSQVGSALDASGERIVGERRVSVAVDDLLAELGPGADPDLEAAQFHVRVAGRIHDDCALAYNARLRSASARMLARPLDLAPRPYLLGDPEV
ncbi:MAG: hypothetical protein R6X29_12150 [Acidimicrobiia bacterium]|jgi:hypothetical protein